MGEYKKMSLLIEENKDELIKQLLGKKLPADAESIQRLCAAFIGKLTDRDSVYMKQFSILEQDLLTRVLSVMDMSYASDMELSRKINKMMLESINRRKEQQESSKEMNWTIWGKGKKYGREYIPALAGAIGGAFVVDILVPKVWVYVLLGSIFSAIVGRILYGIFISKSNGPLEDVESPEYALTKSDISNILRRLISVGENIDNVLLIYRNHIEILQDEHAREKKKLSLDKKYVGVLECIQTVLGNLKLSEQTPLVRDSIKQIVNSLANQGYEVVHYSDQNRAYFKETEGNCEGFDEFKPAILRYDEDRNAVLKGEVLISSNNV